MPRLCNVLWSLGSVYTGPAVSEDIGPGDDGGRAV